MAPASTAVISRGHPISRAGTGSVANQLPMPPHAPAVLASACKPPPRTTAATTNAYVPVLPHLVKIEPTHSPRNAASSSGTA